MPLSRGRCFTQCPANLIVDLKDLIVSQSHRTIWVGKGLEDHLVPLLAFFFHPHQLPFGSTEAAPGILLLPLLGLWGQWDLAAAPRAGTAVSREMPGYLTRAGMASRLAWGEGIFASLSPPPQHRLISTCSPDRRGVADQKPRNKARSQQTADVSACVRLPHASAWDYVPWHDDLM